MTCCDDPGPGDADWPEPGGAVEATVAFEDGCDGEPPIFGADVVSPPTAFGAAESGEMAAGLEGSGTGLAETAGEFAVPMTAPEETVAVLEASPFGPDDARSLFDLAESGLEGAVAGFDGGAVEPEEVDDGFEKPVAEPDGKEPAFKAALVGSDTLFPTGFDR